MTDDLMARLRAHSALADVPLQQLEWMIARGTLRRYSAGEIGLRTSNSVEALEVVLSGHLVIHVDRGAGPRVIFEWHGGDLAGTMPYSRLRSAPGTIVYEEDSEIFEIHIKYFPEMIRECYELTAACVHAMLDRARHFTTFDLHEEKMRSLGKLAAGLAHELNNPASAATRSADELTRAVRDLETAAVALGASGLAPSGYDLIARLRRAHLTQPDAPSRSPLAQADWADEVEAWAARQNLPLPCADALADSSVTMDTLDELAREFPPEQLLTVVSWFMAGHSARRLAVDIEVATDRIYSLVAAVKGFTYMDQSTAPQPVNLEQGLKDTVTVLRAKAKSRSVTLSVDVEPGLPRVTAFGGELNQVWSNLIDNALDALSPGGTISVTVRHRAGHVDVCVIDDGPGIPDKVLPQIFDPFFTTKAPGSGTGLGLDIVRRLVVRNGGDVSVDTKPGRTAFKVTFPAAE